MTEIDVPVDDFGLWNFPFSHWTKTFKILKIMKNLQNITLSYTCQLFLRCRREIFILGVLGFLKTTRSFPKIPEVFRRRPKSAEGEVIEKTLIHKIRDREEGIVIYSFYTWFSFLTLVWVNIFLEIVSNKTATTHIFQSGVRNWSAGVSGREIEVFNPQAWDSRLRRESWQVYFRSNWVIHHLECVQLSTLLNKLFVVRITMDLNFKTIFLRHTVSGLENPVREPRNQ